MARLLCFLAGALLLCSCGAGTSGAALPFARQPGALASAPDARAAESWMMPEAKHEDLLYTSDSSLRKVFVLSMPRGKLFGTLAFSDVPRGLCTDRSGNVLVTTSGNSAKKGGVSVFAHGSPKPFLKLIASQGVSACAVDPKTGDLAISGGVGTTRIAVLSPPWGLATIHLFHTSTLEPQLYLSYDDGGDLFFPTVQHSAGNRLFKLPYGATTPVVVRMQGRATDGGAVQWYKTYLGSASVTPGGEAIEHIRAQRERGRIIGATTLQGRGMDFGANQFWIAGGELASPFAYTGGPDGNVGLWSYPDGAQSTVFAVAGAQSLNGVTISQATK